MNPQRSAECINCMSCVRACPTGVDIRNGLDSACINCAECVDACERVMQKSGKRGLIRYAFGAGGEGGIMRQNVYIVGGFLLLFLALTLHLTMTRTAVDVTVLPHAMEPRFTKDGRVINAYVLSVKNKLAQPVELTVTVERFNESMVQSITAPIRVEAGKFDRFPLFVRIKPAAGQAGTRRINLEMDNREQKIHIRKEANFTIPDEI